MVCSLTIVLSRSITGPLLTLFVSTQLGLNQKDVGLLVGIAALTGTMLGLYGGYVVDRLDKRRLLIVSMLSSGIGFILLSFARDLYLTTLALIITESAAALFLIGSKAVISESSSVEQRVRVFSLRYTMTNISFATGPMLGVVLASVNPLAPFWVAGGIAFVSVFLMRSLPGQDSHATPIRPAAGFIRTVLALKSDRLLVLFTLGCLLSAMVHGRFTLYLSQYLLVRYEADEAMGILSAILACNALTVVLLQFQFGRVLNHNYLAFWLGIGSALLIIGLLGFSHADSLVAWCLSMLAFTLGEIIVLPAEYIFIDKIAPDHLKGSYYGAQNLGAIGGALSPMLCGYLLVHSAPINMFFALVAVAALGGCFCFQAVRINNNKYLRGF